MTKFRISLGFGFYDKGFSPVARNVTVYGWSFFGLEDIVYQCSKRTISLIFIIRLTISWNAYKNEALFKNRWRNSRKEYFKLK